MGNYIGNNDPYLIRPCCCKAIKHSGRYIDVYTRIHALADQNRTNGNKSKIK